MKTDLGEGSFKAHWMRITNYVGISSRLLISNADLISRRSPYTLGMQSTIQRYVHNLQSRLGPVPIYILFFLTSEHVALLDSRICAWMSLVPGTREVDRDGLVSRSVKRETDCAPDLAFGGSPSCLISIASALVSCLALGMRWRLYCLSPGISQCLLAFLLLDALPSGPASSSHLGCLPPAHIQHDHNSFPPFPLSLPIRISISLLIIPTHVTSPHMSHTYTLSLSSLASSRSAQ